MIFELWTGCRILPSHYLIKGMTLTHWGRVTHIYVSKLAVIIGSDNGLSPGRRQAITWTNAGILLIRTLGTNISEILCKHHVFSYKKMHLKMSSGKWRPFCLGLNVLKRYFTSLYSLCWPTEWYHTSWAHNPSKDSLFNYILTVWYGDAFRITGPLSVKPIAGF